ncbi:MAG: membrane protein insertase YidC, partial [Geminicoccaceae bacterium]|nr:membrane protein insertase YidC [Geminicoccaceae bacterium]
MPEQRNLILAIVLSVTIIIAFQYFYELPRMKEAQQREQAVATQETTGEATGVGSAPAAPDVEGVRPAPPGAATAAAEASRDQVVAETARLPFDNGRIRGSIALRGGRIDDLVMTDYRVGLEPGSPPVTLLNPPGAPSPYFAEFGWVPAESGVEVPGSDTLWEADGQRLAPGNPVTLTHRTEDGLLFERQIELDDDFLFTVTQRVTNESGEPVTLHPYGLVSRWGTPPTLGFFILHEGPIGVLQNQLEEIDYDDLQDTGTIESDSVGGWLGITDKYWLTSLVPDQSEPLHAVFRHSLADGEDRYQTDYLREPLTVAPGETVEAVDRLFAGAKEVDLLDEYGEQFGIPLFDRAVDFGWFYFLTKPFFHILHALYLLVGNYGIAILIFTLLVKIVFFPLANKSYRAMSKMKKLQPEMMRLREQYGDDKARMNQELMALYKKEKVNPMSGCLPILIQIPVFFALYKVLFVNIEMRHAPFFGWIKDLSAADPTSVFNLFGLIPWTPPEFLLIGAWPLIMGLSMYLQQKLNPQPTD